jgi:hypothetical protein
MLQKHYTPKLCSTGGADRGRVEGDCADNVTYRRMMRGAALLAAVLLLGALGVSASAEDGSVPPISQRTTKTVTADGLPTAQIDGTVFAQVVAGNTVFAGGEFTRARPAGAALGASSEVARSDLLSFDIRTGKLKNFAPAVNGRVRAMALSKDGKLLYAVGNFTRVGTSVRNHFAAFDVKDGHLKKLKADINDTVYSLAVTKKAIYLGGSFTGVNGVPRAKLAAISASSGKLTGWAPVADDTVLAMTMTPDQKKVIVGGRFYLVNGIVARGLAALRATTGARSRWMVNSIVKDYGLKAAIWSLRADKDTVYGTAYTYGGGNFEGAFAVSPADGAIRWLQDCHGDTYDVTPIGNVVYSVGHPHYCLNIGGFPDPEPRTYQHVLAVTKAAKGTIAPNTELGHHYGDFTGQPGPSIINWFPDLTPGTATGLTQAAWSSVGTSSYLVLGGEFTAVNGVPQQGLVRFAIPAKLPKKKPLQGPVDTSSDSAPKITVTAPGVASISWTANWDRDDTVLNYEVLRNVVPLESAKVVDKQKGISEFWNRPTLQFSDTGLAPATTYQYQIRATDPDGNVALSPVTTLTTPA